MNCRSIRTSREWCEPFALERLHAARWLTRAYARAYVRTRTVKDISTNY